MKNRLGRTSAAKRAEITEVANRLTVQHDEKVLCQVKRAARGGDYVRFNNQVAGNSLADSVLYGPVKECENGSVIVKGYNVYQQAHNRTRDTVEVFEVVDSEGVRIHERFNNVDYFLSAESSYWDPSEGKGAKDSVLFQTGQVVEGKEEIDSCVAVSVEQARAFAAAILKVCDEIEAVTTEKIKESEGNGNTKKPCTRFGL